MLLKCASFTMTGLNVKFLKIVPIRVVFFLAGLKIRDEWINVKSILGFTPMTP